MPVFSGLVVVMVSVASTVSEKVDDAVLSAESVTVTTMLNVPAAVGIPEIRPPVERFSPAGNDEPLAAAQVQLYPVPVPPWLRMWLLGKPFPGSRSAAGIRW